MGQHAKACGTPPGTAPESGRRVRRPEQICSRGNYKHIRLIPIEVPLGIAEGMPKPCVVNCDNLRTISKTHLVKKISKIPAKRIAEVKRAVGYALGWEELIEADN